MGENETYCYLMVFMDNIEGIKNEISNISKSEKIGYVSSGNVLMATFKSGFTKKELHGYFSGGELIVGRNFFIIEPDGNSVSFADEKILTTLYGVFDDVNENDFNVGDLSSKERSKMINNILDKGSDITKDDQDLLDKLVDK